MYRLVILFVAMFVVSCGSQRKLQRAYLGQPIAVLEKEFGRAKTVFEKDEGKEYIFEKVEYLKSAEISQHKLALDPMVSPEAKKTSRYYVTVVDGVIIDMKFEEEYERR